MAKPPSFETQSVIDALTAARPAAGDSKFVVCLFLRGGADSHQMYVPRGASNPNTALYEAARRIGVRITQPEVLPLAGTTTWGLHPNLTHLQSRWASGDVAVVREVGTLNLPITKAQYFDEQAAGRNRPINLAAHDIQQKLWEEGLQHRPPQRDSGWFGRFAALVNPTWNTNERSDAMFSLFRTGSRQTDTYPGFGPVTLPARVRPSMDRAGMRYAPAAYNSALDFATEQNVFPNVTGQIVRDTVAEVLRASWTAPSHVTANRVALPAAAITATASAAFIRPALEAINTAVNKPGLGIRAGVAMINIGGWDHHSGLRANQDPMLAALNATITAFTDAVAAMGLQDRVVLFTETEFSRTFTNNGNMGTDHAWAGHSFVVGTPVVGGAYGPEPDYRNTTAIDNWSLNAGGGSGRSPRGVFIPRISTEQYYATLLRWMGIPANLVPLILPAYPLYSPGSLGFLPTRN